MLTMANAETQEIGDQMIDLTLTLRANTPEVECLRRKASINTGQERRFSGVQISTTNTKSKCQSLETTFFTSTSSHSSTEPCYITRLIL